MNTIQMQFSEQEYHILLDFFTQQFRETALAQSDDQRFDLLAVGSTLVHNKTYLWEGSLGTVKLTLPDQLVREMYTTLDQDAVALHWYTEYLPLQRQLKAIYPGDIIRHLTDEGFQDIYYLAEHELFSLLIKRACKDIHDQQLNTE